MVTFSKAIFFMGFEEFPKITPGESKGSSITIFLRVIFSNVLQPWVGHVMLPIG